jgi:hypothetical protein
VPAFVVDSSAATRAAIVRRLLAFLRKQRGLPDGLGVLLQPVFHRRDPELMFDGGQLSR